MSGVLIRTADYLDPRFSTPQLRALEAVAAADPAARLLGLDAHMRPVVEARLGIPREKRVYAIQRNGDPAAVIHDRPGQALSEYWSDARGEVAL